MSGLIDHYVSLIDDQVQFLSRGLIGLPLWAGLIPLASGALGAEAGVGLFVTSASVGVFFLITLFTTIGRLAKIADSQPEPCSRRLDAWQRLPTASQTKLPNYRPVSSSRANLGRLSHLLPRQ